MRFFHTNPDTQTYVDVIASSQLPRQTRVVGVALASHANQQAVSSPGIHALSRGTGLTGAQVGRALRDLVICGYATRTRHPNNGAKRAFDRYSLRVPA